jgi:hypothetical protein
MVTATPLTGGHPLGAAATVRTAALAGRRRGCGTRDTPTRLVVKTPLPHFPRIATSSLAHTGHLGLLSLMASPRDGSSTDLLDHLIRP